MKTSLSETSLKRIAEGLRPSLDLQAVQFPGESIGRQPVHTVYGGAHLFKSDTAIRLGKNALKVSKEYLPDPQILGEVFDVDAAIAETVFQRVSEKLSSEAVEDLRIDFEDGYGIRPDLEEDEHAVFTGGEVAKGIADGTLPPFIGLRIKALSTESFHRGLRTLDLFLTSLAAESGGILPHNFVVTLPKIILPEQVSALCDALDEIEKTLGINNGLIKVEIMIETTQSIFAVDGRAAMPSFVKAARGRCSGAHFGAYDYTAACGITVADQDLLHPACDFARYMMQVSLGGTGVYLSDGATNLLPIAQHKGENLSPEQIAQNRSTIHAAWKLHFDHCRHSMSNGFYQGWDLHPAQIVSRYAAVFSFFLENVDVAASRLKNFVEVAARATLVGDVFDDAATGQGLLNFFLRAINCGAITESETVTRTALTLDDLRSQSFAKILESRTSTLS